MVLFTTLSVSAPGKSNFHKLLECWILQLLSFNIPSQNLVVMVAHENVEVEAVCLKYKVPTVSITPIKSDITSDYPYYQWQASKFNIFDLYVDHPQYTEETVAYYDMDMLFSIDPKLCIKLCQSNSRVCATRDRHWLIEKQAGYFNAGMMIVKQSAQTKKDLIAYMNKIGPQTFAEQDVMNKFFKSETNNPDYQTLPRKCNLVGPSLADLRKNNSIIHEKAWDIGINHVPPVCKALFARKSLFASKGDLQLRENVQQSHGPNPTDCFDVIGCKQSGPCALCPQPNGKCCRKDWKYHPHAANLDPTSGAGCALNEGCQDTHCCVAG
jgi:hypothetical protein